MGKKPDNFGQVVGKVLKEFNGDEGLEIFRKITRLRITYSTYRSNFIQLKKKLSKYYQSYEIVKENSIRRWRTQRDIGRQFTNTILTSQTFLEHYHKKKENRVFHAFMKELRNFITHKESLSITSHLIAKSREIDIERFDTFQQQEFMSYIEGKIEKDIKKNHLQSTYAKQYITGRGKKIKLNKVIDDYHVILEEIYTKELTIMVSRNIVCLKELISEAHILNEKLKQFNFNYGFPLNSIQLKYLECLVEKVRD